MRKLFKLSSWRHLFSKAILAFSPGLRAGWVGTVLLAFAFVACGDDSSTSVNDDESSSSKTVALSSSSSQKGTEPAEVSSSSKKNTASSSWSGAIGSSNSKPSSSSQKSDPGTSSGMTSSSKKSVASSSSRHSGPDPESSSNKKISSSSSVIPASSGNLPSSSSKKVESSSSEYVPFDHSKTLAAGWRIGGDDRYKQFTDPRNGRSYYYITITSVYSGDSVTVMAENLNIGEMVLGKDDQKDDTRIERYCYNNDTTKCDEFGGLYQWAEMMQLPSRCNTESCSNLIQPNHRGICPEGWRLMTYDDYVVIEGYKDEFGYGIKGLRSAYGFGGNNYSGWSLTGAGMRTKRGGFEQLQNFATWFFPTERDPNEPEYANAGVITSSGTTGPKKTSGDLKVNGFSVRCVKLE